MPPDAPSKNSFCEPLFITGNSNIEISDGEFSEIGRILLSKRGFNLDAYKDGCVRRRIAIRVRANHCETAGEYCELLPTLQGEIDQLLKVLTIHVSQFFRNAPVFEKLRLEIIPQLFDSARQKGAKELRFWSLGCSSGEEPYTLALILAEFFSIKMKEIPVIIDAMDVDAATLDQAKKGIFSIERMLELPLNYLQSYFTEEGHQYRLVPKITEMVNFKQGDLLSDHLYRRCDLLLCRNVLIYFSREQQEKIFRNIARVLDRDGFLVLGKSETILGDSRAMFKTVCPVERIYRCI